MHRLLSSAVSGPLLAGWECEVLAGEEGGRAEPGYGTGWILSHSKRQRPTCARPNRATNNAVKTTTRPGSRWPKQRRNNRARGQEQGLQPPRPWTRGGGWRKRPKTRCISWSGPEESWKRVQGTCL